MRPLGNHSEVEEGDYKWLEKIDPKTAGKVLKVGDLVTWAGCMNYFYLTNSSGRDYDNGHGKEYVISHASGKLYRVPAAKQPQAKALAMQEYLEREGKV